MKHAQRPMILTSVLLCLLIIKVIDVVSDRLYRVDYPQKRAYSIEGVDVSSENQSNNSQQTMQPEDLSKFMATADVERGKKIAQKCVQCHSFNKGGAHKVGPNLWNTIGAKIAHMINYPYSKILSDKKNETWDLKALNEFLYKPSQFAKGTKMSFIGLKNPQDRADVIAYMNSMSDSSKVIK